MLISHIRAVPAVRVTSATWAPSLNDAEYEFSPPSKSTSKENVEPAGATMLMVRLVQTSARLPATNRAMWVPDSGKRVEPLRARSAALVTALTRLGGLATNAPSVPPSKPL